MLYRVTIEGVRDGRTIRVRAANETLASLPADERARALRHVGMGEN